MRSFGEGPAKYTGKNRGEGGHILDRVEEEREKATDKKSLIKAVIFVPQTEHSGLAKILRENEEEMLKVTGYKLKIVERAGKSLTSMLTQSNPWAGNDCGRSCCLICQTKAETGKNLHQSCSKRSVVYETWCADCLAKKKDTPEGEERGGVFKYIGETAKSAYERGANHLYDRKNLDLGSHMLKHALEHHGDEDPNDVKFHMKVLS